MVSVWLAALVALGAMAGVVGSEVESEPDLPNVEARVGLDLLDEHFDGQIEANTGNIVILSDGPLSEETTQASVEAYLEEVGEIEDVTVRSPYESEAISDRGEHAGRLGLAVVEVPELSPEDQLVISAEIKEVQPNIAGAEVAYGGPVFQEMGVPSSELLGLAFAVVILILAFGSVLAMGLPISVALGGIGAGIPLALLLSNLVKMPDFTMTLGMMLGLGVGIDYALFIVTRYREHLRAGQDVESAIVNALDTSGRAVLFAGITVVVSLLGMLLMQVSFVNGLALGTATVVAVTLIASLTLLPALLGFAGHRIEVTRWRGLIAVGFVALGLVGLGLKLPALAMVAFPAGILVLIASRWIPALNKRVPRRPEKPLRETRAYRWSRVVQNHPWAGALLSAGLLIALALPVAALRLGFSDDGNESPASTSRIAYDLVSEGFGPGHNGPVMLIAETGTGSPPESMLDLTDTLGATDGVDSVRGPIPNNFEDPAASTAVIWQLIPTTAPQDSATSDLVHNLRDDVIPAATAGTDLDILVTGWVPMTVDFSDYLSARMPLFFGAVLALSFLLLMVVFRSLLVPLKAVVMNLLSIGAAFGLIVIFFQWGTGGEITGIQPAPVEPFLPMMLFAIVFGLSMDYEVFLLSRIHEEWVRSGDSKASVADGLAATAKVITAAAAIMVFVFGSFILETDRIVRLMGFGLAVAVFLDATIVRMLLVPATMELLGDRNWWLPKWLDRIIPNVNIEGSSLANGSGDTPGDPPAMQEDPTDEPSLV